MAQHFHTLLSATSYYHQKGEQLISQHISSLTENIYNSDAEVQFADVMQSETDGQGVRGREVGGFTHSGMWMWKRENGQGGSC